MSDNDMLWREFTRKAKIARDANTEAALARAKAESAKAQEAAQDAGVAKEGQSTYWTTPSGATKMAMNTARILAEQNETLLQQNRELRGQLAAERSRQPIAVHPKIGVAVSVQLPEILPGFDREAWQEKLDCITEDIHLSLREAFGFIEVDDDGFAEADDEPEECGAGNPASLDEVTKSFVAACEHPSSYNPRIIEEFNRTTFTTTHSE